MTAVYHNPLALRQAAHPEKFFGREVKEALPVRKTDISARLGRAFPTFLLKHIPSSSVLFEPGEAWILGEAGRSGGDHTDDISIIGLRRIGLYFIQNI